jgi:hypothetical protein
MQVLKRKYGFTNSLKFSPGQLQPSKITKEILRAGILPQSFTAFLVGMGKFR